MHAALGTIRAAVIVSFYVLFGQGNPGVVGRSICHFFSITRDIFGMMSDDR